MLSPFENLSDCNFTIYSIQLNLYGFLLEQMGYWAENLIILHANDETGKLERHIIKFMPNEVKKIVKYTRSGPIIPKQDDLWNF